MAEQRKRGSQGSKTRASKGGARSTGGAKGRAKSSGGSKGGAAKASGTGKGRAKSPARKTAARKSTATASAPTETRQAGPRVAPDRARQVPARSALKDSRDGRVPAFLGVLGLVATAVIAVILIFGGDDDENATVESSGTPSVAIKPTETGPAPNDAETPTAPAGKVGARSTSCDPLVGSGTANSGQTYAVTSSATDGAPADCTEARSVLLTALSDGVTTIGAWQCTTNPSGPMVASCTSNGGRKIRAGR